MGLFRKLVNANKNVARRFVESIKNFIAKVKSTFSWNKAKADTAAQEKYGTTVDGLEKTVKQYESMLDVTADAVKSGTIENTAGRDADGVEYSFKGYDEKTGKGIYESSFPIGTPKVAKRERVLELVQNIWSKQPIELTLKENGKERKIQANFDPTYDPNPAVKTDLSKLMGGNRHGSAAEQRVTLSLADDYYQIASESKHNYSKDEIGKETETHKDVKQWHYFINDILFQEQGETQLTPYRVTINVKEKSDGAFVYSFNAEKQNEGSSTRQTLHADVTPSGKDGGNAKPFNNSIPDSSEKSNTQKSLKTGDLLSKEYKPSPEKRADDIRPYNENGAEERSYIEDTGLDTYFDDMEKRAQVVQDKRIEDAEKALMSGADTKKETRREKLQKSASFVTRKVVNSGDTVRKIEKKTKDKTLYPAFNNHHSVTEKILCKIPTNIEKNTI